MNHFFVFLSFALILSCNAPKKGQTSRDSETLAKSVVLELSSSNLAGRFPGTDGFRKAAEFMEEQFAKLNLAKAGDNNASYRQVFPSPSTQSANAQAFNLVASLPGKTTNTFVIGAHLDHLRTKNGSSYPGADDNASGVFAVLDTARRFASAGTLNHTFLFVLFSTEETGMNGSKYFVSKLSTRKEKVKFMFNFDMVGHSFGKLNAWGFASSPQGLKIIKHLIPNSDFKVTFNDVLSNNSDHFTFYSENIPIGMFHTGLHEFYHKPTDTPEHMDFDNLDKVSELASKFLVELDTQSQIDFKAVEVGEGLHLDDSNEYVRMD